MNAHRDATEAVSPETARTTTARNAQPALELRNVAKTYPGVVALHGVDFTLAPGEIRALLGKNGAGKSTLMRIACGNERPDSGEVLVDGESVAFRGPSDARARGIEIVYQELNLVPWVTVAEAMSIGDWPKSGGRIDRNEMKRRANEAFARVGVDIDPALHVYQLSTAQQQLLEIGKAISRHPKVLLLDEPTSSLAAAEVDRLLDVVRRIAAEGVAVIYVSHRLAEIAQLVHSVTVLRDGRLVETGSVEQVTGDRIVRLMMGDSTNEIDNSFESPDLSAAPVALRVRDLSVGGLLEHVDFDLHRGEVLGIAGLLGSGRSELLRVLAGFAAPDAGTIELGSGQYRPHIRHMLDQGVALCPEDRRVEGLIPHLGVHENLAIGRWSQLSTAGRVSWSAVRSMATDIVRRLSIKTADITTPIGTLSGGNKQKVMIGRWLELAHTAMLLDEPTRGVDVEAKAQIYRTIRQTAAVGSGVLVVTSEPEELLLCCDTVLFLAGGRASEKHARKTLTAEKLISLSSGAAS